MRAASQGDIETVLELMAPEVVFLTCGNPPMRGRKTFAAAMREMAKDGQIDCKSAVREITVSGSYAFCWNYITVTIKPHGGGLPLKKEGNVLSVFRKERGGKWVLWRDANLLEADRPRD